MKKISCYFSLFSIVIVILVTTISQAYSSGYNKQWSKNYRRIIVFGDSLADIGNLPPMLFLTPAQTPGLVAPPPTRYDRGRFSNGPTITDYLAKKLGVLPKVSNTGFGKFDSVSFAHGGATTYPRNLTPGGFPVPGVLGQVSQFLNADTNTQIDRRTIILILAGGNDYLMGMLDPDNAPPINPSVTVSNIRSAVDQLYARGGRRFVLFNVPDLGRTPICFGLNICDPLGNLTKEHNGLFAEMIMDLKREHAGISIADINLFAKFGRILDAPEKRGFTGSWKTSGPATGCIFQNPTTFNPINCNLLDTFETKLIYWDELHPTTRVSKQIANRVWRVMKRKLY